MANFLEIDVYVLVACPENSLVDSHEFYKPVITPFEMELACIKYGHACTHAYTHDTHTHTHIRTPLSHAGPGIGLETSPRHFRISYLEQSFTFQSLMKRYLRLLHATCCSLQTDKNFTLYFQDSEPEYSLITGGLLPGKEISQSEAGRYGYNYTHSTTI